MRFNAQVIGFWGDDVAVSDIGGFTTVGELLGRTQPTVSLTTVGEDIYRYEQNPFH